MTALTTHAPADKSPHQAAETSTDTREPQGGAAPQPGTPVVEAAPTQRRDDHSEVEERTAELFDRIAACTEEERPALLEEVVLLNLPLADSLARRFRHRGEDEDDLAQVARAGLTEAAHRYEPDRGPFAGFAVPTILGVLKRHFRDRGWMVRPPRRCQEVVLSIRRAWPELTQELQAEPTDAELASYIGESVEAVCAARQAEQGYRPVAMDLSPTEGVHAESDDTSEIGACEARLLIEQAVQSLDERERRLVYMRFYQQRTQSDIAVELGTSQMQVSRLLARVMHKLRDTIGGLDDCADAA